MPDKNLVKEGKAETNAGAVSSQLIDVRGHRPPVLWGVSGVPTYESYSPHRAPTQADRFFRSAVDIHFRIFDSPLRKILYL